MNAPDPSEPFHNPDPLLRRIREALRARRAGFRVRSVVEARADMDARLHAAQLSVESDATHQTGQTGASHRSGWRPGRRSHLRSGWLWAAGAACAALVLGGTWLARYGPRAVQAPQITRTYATATGQRATLRLADGTVVTLAPRTVLRVTEFDRHTRRVLLDGEARFAVAAVAGAPFEVETGPVSTRVLGTTFFVRRYADDAETRVAVQSGKVRVTANSRQRPSVVLTAGRVGHVTDSSATLIVPDDMTPYTGWLDGRLVFHNAPTGEVLATLGRWYGYRFRLSDSTLAAKNLTAVLSTQSSRAALATLELLLNVDLAVDGTTVTLTPRRKPRTSAELRDLRYRRDGITIHTTSEVGR